MIEMFPVFVTSTLEPGVVAALSRLPLVVSSSLDRQGACFIAEHRSLDQHNA